jgi:16S rRNA (uracil1498-N3)-methyltransferase
MTRRRRFVLATPPEDGQVAWISGDELHHMRDVTRLAEGAPVELTDSTGAEYIGNIVRYERERAEIHIESRAVTHSHPKIILAAAIIKGPRMDFIVEKAAELGASELWPIVSTRGLVRAPGEERLARWSRLAIAAAKQSLATAPMTIRAPLTFDNLIRAVPPETLTMICQPGAQPLSDLLAQRQAQAVLLACGPEGDFDRAELEAAAASDFAAVGLGPNRLRSETAAIAAVSIAAERLHRGS